MMAVVAVVWLLQLGALGFYIVPGMGQSTVQAKRYCSSIHSFYSYLLIIHSVPGTVTYVPFPGHCPRPGKLLPATRHQEEQALD